MKELDKGNFRNEWEKAFNDAALIPSDNVWTNVELSLANAEGGSFKKRLMVFKLLAAASVSLVMIIGGGQLFKLYESEFMPADEFTVTENESGLTIDSNVMEVDCNTESGKYYDIDKGTVLADVPLKASESNECSENDQKHQPFSTLSDNLTAQSINSTSSTANSKSTVAANVNARANANEQSSVDDKTHLDKAYSLEKSKNTPQMLESLFADLEVKQPEMVEMKMVPWYTYVSNKKKTNNARDLWAGVNMLAGNFEPNGSSSSGTNSLTSLETANDILNVNEYKDVPLTFGQEQTGRSIGVGLIFGKQIANRIFIISGMNYLQQSTSSYSNVLANDGAGLRPLSGVSEIETADALSLTDFYEIKNTYEMVSIPIQAGYLLLDKRFGIMVLGGFANDLFLRRNISDNTGDGGSVTATSRDDGYSIYSIGGLIGTELSYTFGENYSISLQPQVRQALSTFTPNGNKPTVLEVGFKFKYILK
jgi:hypothetical protein